MAGTRAGLTNVRRCPGPRPPATNSAAWLGLDLQAPEGRQDRDGQGALAIGKTALGLRGAGDVNALRLLEEFLGRFLRVLEKLIHAPQRIAD
jgi:hypothetical protein